MFRDFNTRKSNPLSPPGISCVTNARTYSTATAAARIATTVAKVGGASAAAASLRTLLLRLVLGGSAAGGAFTFLSIPEEQRTQVVDGMTRSLKFWRGAFPIYLHYLLVEKQVAGLDDAKQNEEFNKLHDRYASRVEQLALSLRGFYTKSAQIVSTRDELVPKQYLKWAKKMQDQVPTELTADEVRAIIEKSLGRKLETMFDDFSFEPLGAASIGQVHLATLKDTKTKVVVKVQYPGIEAKFRADMKTIRSFCELAMPHHVPFLAEIEKQFLTEFDYRGEAKNLLEVHDNLCNDKQWSKKVFVPKPFMDMCSKQVLTMELVPGKKLVDGVRDQFELIAKAQGKTLEEFEAEHKKSADYDSVEKARKRMARIQALFKARDVVVNNGIFLYNHLLASWLPGLTRVDFVHSSIPINLGDIIDVLLRVHGHEIFVDRAFNADCHPGNVILMPDNRLGLIDYGQVKHMDRESTIKYAKLIVALADDNKDEVVRIATEEMGVRTKNMNPDVIYKLMCFQHDRDTPDITGGRNIHKFMEWMDQVDPVTQMPEEYIMAGRVSILLRGVANAFQLSLCTSKYWKPLAQRVLEEDRRA